MEVKTIRYLCHECIGDDYLKADVKAQGIPHKCSFCNRNRRSFNLDDIASRVNDIFRENYGPSEYYPSVSSTSDNVEWVQHGKYPEVIISDMMGVNDEVANEILEIIADKYDYSDYHHGDIPFYDTMSLYEEFKIHPYEYSEIWYSFCQSIKHKARFYNSEAGNLLDGIFEGIQEYRSLNGIPAIRTIPESNVDRFIYRGRQADDNLTKLKIFLFPQRELGAPPPTIVNNGRMNPPGISVFYGAFERETCIAEIRLPVGSSGVTGQFEIIKPLRVLDLTVFDKPYERLSMFDPNYQQDVRHRLFLRDFHKEIRKPILPRDEPIEYLPTQVVAEYLANKFDLKLDGVIYSSTQTGGQGHNIVLFNHATGTEGAEGNYSSNNLLDQYEIEEDEYGFLIQEKRKPDLKDKKSSKHGQIVISLEDLYSAPQSEDKVLTLRFIQNSLRIDKVTAIEQSIENKYFWIYSHKDLEQDEKRNNDLCDKNDFTF